MKKIFALCALVVVVLLTSCSAPTANKNEKDEIVTVKVYSNQSHKKLVEVVYIFAKDGQVPTLADTQTPYMTYTTSPTGKNGEATVKEMAESFHQDNPTVLVRYYDIQYHIVSP